MKDNHPDKISSNLYPIIIIGTLFFIFGFVTWLNSVLIPYLKIACELNNFMAYMVTFAFYISYLLMAIPSSWILKAIGFKKGLSAGLTVMAVGALIFIPAAMERAYFLFLTGLFVQGTGLAILQTASNPYITLLGSAESAAKRISIMGICNKIAGALAPIVLGAVALKDTDALELRLLSLTGDDRNAALDSLASRVILPYVIITIVLLVLAILIYYSKLPEIDTDKEDTAGENRQAKSGITQFPNLMLGVGALFMYVGVEVLAADTIISYGAFKGASLSASKAFTTYTLVLMLAGYLLGIFTIPRYLSQQKALVISAATGILFSILIIVTDGYVSIAFVALLGLSNALIWPGIWAVALNGLGRFTKKGSSLLIMAISGGALIPLLYGYLVDVFDPQSAYWILVPCYSFIMFYGIRGLLQKKSTQ